MTNDDYIPEGFVFLENHDQIEVGSLIYSQRSGGYYLVLEVVERTKTDYPKDVEYIITTVFNLWNNKVHKQRLWSNDKSWPFFISSI